MKTSHILAIAVILSSVVILTAGTPVTGATITVIEREGSPGEWFYDVRNDDPSLTLIGLAIGNDFGFSPFSSRGNWSVDSTYAHPWDSGILFGPGSAYNTATAGVFGDLFPNHDRIFFFDSSSLASGIHSNQSSLGEFGFYSNTPESDAFGFFNDGSNTGPFFTQPIPEPATLGLFAIGVGLVGLASWRRRRRS